MPTPDHQVRKVSRLARLEEQANTVIAACKELVSSARLARIFQRLLLIGNTMNGADAKGFR